MPRRSWWTTSAASSSTTPRLATSTSLISKGTELEPDKTGMAAWHWPGLEDIGMLIPTSYISKDAPKDRK